MKKIFILIIFFYLLVLFQVSFLVPFSWGRGWLLNFILISVILIALFEKSASLSDLFPALIGGFFLDIFSERFFGFWILILLGITLFIKYILKRYISFPFPVKT